MGGELTAFLGPMRADKTTNLINLGKKEKYAHRTFRFYKPTIDNRYSETDIVTNDGVSIEANAIPETGFQIILDFEQNPVQDIFIDEIQFFESSIIEVIRVLNFLGVNIYYAGLSTISENRPFPFKDANEEGYPHMGDLLAGLHHTKIIVNHAYCEICQEEAYFTHSIVKKTEAVKVGGEDEYMSLCPKCYHELNPEPISDIFTDEIKEKIEILQRFHNGWRD